MYLIGLDYISLDQLALLCSVFISSGTSNSHWNNLPLGSISPDSSNIYVGFIFIVHYNYISYHKWHLHRATLVAFWECCSPLAASRIRKCGKSIFQQSQALAKPETFFADRSLYSNIHSPPQNILLPYLLFYKTTSLPSRKKSGASDLLFMIDSYNFFLPID